MPAFLYVFGRFLGKVLFGSAFLALPELARRLMITFGVGAVTFVGMGFLLDQIKSLAFSSLTGMPALSLQVVGLLNIDIAFNVVMSAYAIKLTVRTLNNTARLTTIGLTGGH